MKSENLNTPDCIRTFTGKYVNVFEPDPETICIEDIAHALSNLCRFGGHTPKFFSVAEHSLNCYADAIGIVETKFELLSIFMHDASEAYLCDLPRPIKNHMQEYVNVEKNLQKVIAEKYLFSWDKNIYERIDNLELQKEFFWITGDTPLSRLQLSPEEAKSKFLEVFHYLTKGKYV